MDGQQRIRSILEFAKNDLELSGEELSSRLIGKTFDDLSPQEKSAFWNYDVVTRELQDATDGDIRDLFRRLNISAVNLNDQELRHAKYTGEFLSATEELADDPWWVDHRIVNLRQVRRMEDVEYVSELLIVLMAGPQDKKKTIEDYYADYDASFPEKATWLSRFKKTQQLLSSLLTPEQIKSWNGKSDFYSLFHTLGKYVEQEATWTPKQLKKAASVLEAFRKQVVQAKRKDNKKKFPRVVNQYADAVSRAATDAARRTLRSEILFDLVEKARSA